MTEFLEDFTEKQLRGLMERNRKVAQRAEEGGGIDSSGPLVIACLLEEADMAEKELERRQAEPPCKHDRFWGRNGWTCMKCRALLR